MATTAPVFLTLYNANLAQAVDFLGCQRNKYFPPIPEVKLPPFFLFIFDVFLKVAVLV